MAAAYLWVGGSDPSRGRVLIGVTAAAIGAFGIVLVAKRWLPEDGSASMAGFGFALLMGMLTIWFARYYVRGH